MQESILSNTATQRLYSQRGILIGTILGGPLVTGYLLTRNYTALEKKEYARKTWLLCIGAFIVISLLTILLPQQVPAFLFLFINAAFGYYITQYLQGKVIEEHIACGGPLHSNWRCVGISLIFTLIIIALAFACFFAADMYAGKV